LRPEPYLFGLRLAIQMDNLPGMKWASLGILKQEWPKNQRKVFQEAQNAADAVVERLKSQKHPAEATAFQAQIKQALHRQMRVLADCRRFGALRTEHSELPSQLVLARGRPVGVEQIPLIEHRVSHRTNSVDAHCSLTRSASSALSSRSITESQLVRPCSAL